MSHQVGEAQLQPMPLLLLWSQAVNSKCPNRLHELTRIMTALEQRFMESVPARLRGIEEQMKRIADALEKIAGNSKEPTKEETL